MTLVRRNGLDADLEKWEQTCRESAQRYAEKQRAQVRSGERTTQRNQGSEEAALRKRRGGAGHRAARHNAEFSKATRGSIRHRSGGRCEVGLPGCLGDATQVHHRKLRRHGDNRRQNGLDICVPCHTEVHADVERSYKYGWLVRSEQDPATVPVLVRIGRLYLTADGFYASKPDALRLVSPPALVVSGLPEDKGEIA